MSSPYKPVYRDDKLLKTISKNIYSLLREHEVKQYELAEWSGVSQAVVCNYVSPNPPDMRISGLKAIADTFKVSVDWLLEEH